MCSLLPGKHVIVVSAFVKQLPQQDVQLLYLRLVDVLSIGAFWNPYLQILKLAAEG